MKKLCFAFFACSLFLYYLTSCQAQSFKTLYPHLADVEIETLQEVKDSLQANKVTWAVLTKEHLYSYNLETKDQAKLKTEKSIVITVEDPQIAIFKVLSTENTKAQMYLAEIFLHFAAIWGYTQYDMVEIRVVKTSILGAPNELLSRVYIKQDCEGTDHYCPAHYRFHSTLYSGNGGQTVLGSSMPKDAKTYEFEFKNNNPKADKSGLYVKYSQRDALTPIPQGDTQPAYISVLEDYNLIYNN